MCLRHCSVPACADHGIYLPELYTGSLGWLCLVAQSSPTLCDPVDCSLPGFSVHRDSPGKNTWVGCQALIKEIFLTQGSTQVSCIAGKFFIMWATRGWHDCAIHYVLGFLSPLPQFSDSRNITKTKSPSYPENLSKKVYEKENSFIFE